MSEYDRTKWVAHYEVAEPMIAEGLPLTIVMPGLIYGPGDTSSARTTFLQYLGFAHGRNRKSEEEGGKKVLLKLVFSL